MARLQYSLLALILVLASCQQKKVKVIYRSYDNGRQMTVLYFNHKADAAQHITLNHKDGLLSADKPLSFDYECYFENGKLSDKGSFANGKSNGLWQYYYETGIQQAACYYVAGLTRYSVHCWYPSGNTKRTLVEADTATHHWHGIDYYDTGGKSIEYSMFKNDSDKWAIDGPWAEWYEGGKPKFKATFRQNFTVGEWQEWDSTGKLKTGKEPVNFTF